MITYPEAQLRRVDPAHWTTPDGYTVTQVVKALPLSTPVCEFHVYTPAGQERAVCCDLGDVRLTIAALQYSGGEYGQPWLAYAKPTSSLY